MITDFICNKFKNGILNRNLKNLSTRFKNIKIKKSSICLNRKMKLYIKDSYQVRIINK